jgi:putative ABC transport system permease protein
MFVAVQDVRHAFRLMHRAPGFTVAAVVTLALAIGANTAVFSVVYGVLLRPLPYPDADRLVMLSEEHPGGRSLVPEPRLSDLTFRVWSTGSQTIEGLGGYSSNTVTFRSDDQSERLVAASLAPSVFTILRVAPALGRFFRDEHSRDESARVVVLSDSLWRNRFAGDPGAIGRTVLIDGMTHEIVGVAPAWFYFPRRDAQLWRPYVLAPRRDGSVSVMTALARLRPGVSVQQAAAEGTAAARSVTRPFAAEMLFGKGAPVEVRVRTLGDQITRRFRPALAVLMSAVTLVLLVACANVANLLLARGTSRSRELAVRAALGAGGVRLARQLLTETAILALAGGALGVLLAWSLITSLPAWAPDGFPRLDDVRLDAWMLGFTSMVSLGAGILAGAFPALRAARTDLTSAMRVGDGRSSAWGGRVRAVLLAAEAALSVTLLIGAALLTRSFVALVSVDPGYSAANVLTGRVYLSGTGARPERRVEIVRALVNRLQSAPGVVAAGVSNMAPLGESSFVSGFKIGINERGEEVAARALGYVVTHGYCEALGIRLEEGRLPQPGDETSAVQAMLVNESFVRTYMRDGKPVVGRRFQGLVSDDLTEIVGIVGDVLKDGLDTEPQPEIYLAHNGRAAIRREINVAIRTARDPAAFAPTLRSIVSEVEPLAALGRVGPLSSQVATSVSEPRFATATIVAFAAVSLGIAAAGLYGVLSYSVSQRRREIGIRAALGATRGNLIALVVRQGMQVTVAGLCAGVLISLLGAKQLQPLLFGIRPLDVLSFIVMPLVLIAVALAACIVPARRAASTDPATTLRSE